MPDALVATPDTSAMLPRFGPLYVLGGLPWFFRRLRMEEHSVERVARAAAQGGVLTLSRLTSPA